MIKTLEIKRKVFEVVEEIDQTTSKVIRKDKTFLFLDLKKDPKKFEKIVKADTKLNASGIRHPEIYCYDKNSMQVAIEYIEGKPIFEMLLEGDLQEEIIESIFKANYFAKKAKVGISFDTKDWIWTGEKLVYTSLKVEEWDPRFTFEKDAILYWFFTDEFKNKLISQGIPLNANKHENLSKGELNKKIALLTCKYYM